MTGRVALPRQVPYGSGGGDRPAAPYGDGAGPGRWWRSVWSSGRRVLEITFVEPVRDGGPRARTWPRGLLSIGLTTAVLFALCAVAAAGSRLLRELPLAGSSITGRTMPSILIPLLVTCVIWSLGLLHTAATHMAWWAKVPVLVLLVATTLIAVVWVVDRPLLALVTGVAYVGVVIFVCVRKAFRPAWWEMPVVTAGLAVVVLLPRMVSGLSQRLGYDTRLATVEMPFEVLSTLVIPALMVAGAAPAVLTVTAAEAVATRRWPRPVLVALTVAVVAWRVVVTVRQLSDDPVEHSVARLVAAVVALLVVVGVVLGVMALLRSAPLPRVADLPEGWQRWLLVIAGGQGVIAILLVVSSVVRTLAVILDADAMTRATDIAVAWLREAARPGAIRGVLAVAMIWPFVRLVRQQRRAEAVVLAAFVALGGLAFLDLAGVPYAGDRTVEGLTLVSSWLAILVLVSLAAVRALTWRRLTGLLTVLLVGALYEQRELLEDPMSALLGMAGLGVVLFGLVWEVLTGAAVTRDDSRAMPRPSRLLAYLGVSLLAMSMVAMASLSHVPAGIAPNVLQSLGDSVLGTPLLLATVGVGLWTALSSESV